MYNQQEELQHLGFLGIFKESFKLIFKWHKIFTKITLGLILPLTLARVAFSIFLPSNAIPNTSTLFNSSTQQVSPPPSYNSSYFNSFQWNIYWLVYAIYLILSFVFTLLSISVVAYTVVCIYTNNDITFKNIVSVVSKSLRRLIITSVCVFCAMFMYAVAILLVMFLRSSIMFYFSYKFFGGQVELMVPIFGIIVASVGIAYMSIIWQFANIISVLETSCGFQAMVKSKALIKGNMGNAIGIYLVWAVCSVPSYFLMKHLKMNDGRVSIEFGEKVWLIIFYVVWLTFLNLLNFVVQTVFYLVCKYCHGENVEKALALVDHFEVYDAEYVPLDSKAAQVGELIV